MSAAGAPLGVCLINLGSPSAPTPRAVRRFLAEFLADPLVTGDETLRWWLVRNFIVLPLRGRSSARLYAKIWTPEGSPLVAISRRQREALARELGEPWRVTLGMRYGEPSIADALARLREAGCERALVAPLFPQESRASTGTAVGAARGANERLASPLELSFLGAFPTDEGYLSALAARVRAELAQAPDAHLVQSFHGLPARYVEELGDPYREHCEATAGALAEKLGLSDTGWTLCYQSRFGRERWLEPDAAELVPVLAARHPRVLVVCPGFVADCLETLEEVALRLRAAFEDAGGRELRLVPCLNDHPLWIEALGRIMRKSLPSS